MSMVMNMAKVTAKGQITIPADVREAIGIREGDKVLFVRMDDGSISLRNSSLEALQQAQQSFSEAAAEAGLRNEDDLASHELLLSTFVIEEARAVVARKWPKRREALEQYLLQLSFETIVTPLTPEPDLFDIRDPNDYPVLYSAIIGAADVFVTGDKDFVDVDVETPTIMTPAEFERFFSH